MTRGRPPSFDIEHVISLLNDGHSTKEISMKLGIDHKNLRRCLRRRGIIEDLIGFDQDGFFCKSCGDRFDNQAATGGHLRTCGKLKPKTLKFKQTPSGGLKGSIPADSPKRPSYDGSK